jgi:hypothetical protein
MRCADSEALRGFHCEIHGRRSPDLLRLSASTRGRRGASGAGGTGIDPSGGRVEVWRFSANSCRHCNRLGCRRRSDRFGRGAGARHRGRDAEPCGSVARHCRAEHRRHRREHSKAARQFVRTAGPWGPGSQRRSSRYGFGWRCDRVRWKADSRRCAPRPHR